MSLEGAVPQPRVSESLYTLISEISAICISLIIFLCFYLQVTFTLDSQSRKARQTKRKSKTSAKHIARKLSPGVLFWHWTGIRRTSLCPQASAVYRGDDLELCTQAYH